MKKFVLILAIILLVVVMFRYGLSYDSNKPFVDVVTVTQRILTLRTPWVEMVSSWVEEYQNIKQIIETSFDDFIGDSVVETLVNLWTFLRGVFLAFFVIVRAPYEFAYYTFGLCIDIIEIIGLLLL